MAKIEQNSKPATAPVTPKVEVNSALPASSGLKLSVIVPVLAVIVLLAFNAMGLNKGPAVCGNGILEGDEECDTLIENDGCLKDCKIQQFFVCPNNECYRYGLKGIDRVKDISWEDLMTKYWAKGLMVIIEDGGVSKWKANKLWTPEYFKKLYPNLEIEIQNKRESNPNFEIENDKHRFKTTMGTYVDMILNSTSTNDFYMTANNQFLTRPEVKGLFDDIQPMHEGKIDVAHQQGSGTYFWLGPKGIVTPVHHDPVTLFHTHIKGRKKWLFYPPDQKPYLYNHIGVFSQINPNRPRAELLKEFPLYEKAFSFEETFEPGETLFMPVGWWHHVTSLDRGIGIVFTNFKPESRVHEGNMYRKWGNNAGNLRYGDAEAKDDAKKSASPARIDRKLDKTRSLATFAMLTKVQEMLNTVATPQAFVEQLTLLPGYAVATIRILEEHSCSKLVLKPEWFAWIEENRSMDILPESILQTLYTSQKDSPLTVDVGPLELVPMTWASCYQLDDTKWMQRIAKLKMPQNK